MFSEIAEAYLNRTLLVLRRYNGTEKSYYRAAEIEVYLNDNSLHKDTFTHGEPYQQESSKWVFFRGGSNYTGLELSIGKGENVCGGILLRSMMPVMALPEENGILKVVNTDIKK